MKNGSRQIGIVGTGMIGTSLAVLCTGHGIDTVVFSVSEEFSQMCRDGYETDFMQLVKHGIITEKQVSVCRSHLKITTDYSDMKKVEAVFECIIEDVETKHSVYKSVEENCPNIKAICSSSSSIVPDTLAEGMTKYGDRIVVAHPFNPAHMVPYFEVCASKNTADGVTDYVMKLLQELDRKPVLLKKPTPGFIGNRLQFALLREALSIVESGIADPKDIDTCLNYSFCPRYTSIGIFEHFDDGGLELCSKVSGNLFPILSDQKTVPPILSEKIKAGKSGRKAGEGFYDWRNVNMDEYRERVTKPYWQFCKWNLPKE